MEGTGKVANRKILEWEQSQWVGWIDNSSLYGIRSRAHLIRNIYNSLYRASDVRAVTRLKQNGQMLLYSETTWNSNKRGRQAAVFAVHKVG